MEDKARPEANELALQSVMKACPLVAILRGIRPDEVVAVADALMASGFRLIEVPLNSPDPWESVERLKAFCPDEVMVGAGTVVTPADARRLASLEVPLMVTPNTDPDVIRAGRDAGLASMIGCMTPSEALAGARAGACALKLFPAARLGTEYYRDLKAVLPTGLPVLAVGGVELGNMAAWQTVGIAGFGFGGCLYSPGLSSGEVGRRAAALMAEWQRLQPLRDETP